MAAAARPRQLLPCPTEASLFSSFRFAPHTRLDVMFATAGRCSYCTGPLGFGKYHFCCTECQECWHRQHGTVPRGCSRQSFGQLLREKRAQLDEHERRVKGGQAGGRR